MSSEQGFILPALSAETLSLWAKYDYDQFAELDSWEPLALHLADTAQVAGLCYRYWLSESQRHLLRLAILSSLQKQSATASEAPTSNTVNPHPADVADSVILDCKLQKLVMFLAGVHDIGKATPAFSSQVDVLYRRMRANGLPCQPVQMQQRKTLPHGNAGQILLYEYLTAQKYQSATATALGSVIGGHHGISPTKEQIEPDNINSVLLGESKWAAARAELLTYISKSVGWEEVETDFAAVNWNKAQLVLLQGIVIISDWIASNKNFFPLFPFDSNQPQNLLQNYQLHQQRVMQAWQAIHLPKPWQPENIETNADMLLTTRFAFPVGVKARPLQEKAVELAKTMDLPGILILEDMMGAGKTEASLLAAEILAERSGAAGVLVALPTQATTDAMFKRVLNWLPKMLSQGGDNVAQTISLLHGKAHLNEAYGQLPDIHTEAIGGIDFGTDFSAIGWEKNENFKEENKATAVNRHEWLMSTKKSLLADFVVGTIDQVLMMALQSRYLTLRHLGLSRKVVILDEIHSCDVYMNEYLKMALEWLGAYHVPVIALSATLAPNIRKELVEAYERGASFKLESTQRTRSGRKTPLNPAVQHSDPTPSLGEIEKIYYPVATVKKQNKYQLETIKAAFSSRKVALEMGEWDSAAAIAQQLVSAGGNLLIIHNTVARAQQTYRDLAAETDNPLHLVHARYTAIDRVMNDRWLLDTYGRNAGAKRPQCSIVIATQVVEQSLDVDFDAIITDLAPIDLIYQRIGRVHRHAENERPPALASAKCVVLGIPETAEKHLEKQKSIMKNIYPPLHLLKTADLFNQIILNQGGLNLPQDMAIQVAEVYGQTEIKNENWRGQWQKIKEQYEAETDRQKSLARQYRLGSLKDYPRTNLNDWLNYRSDPNEKNGRAAVRLGEESLEVILVEKVACEDGIYWKLLDHLPEIGGKILPWNSPPSWEESRMLMLSKVRLPRAFTAAYQIDKTIAELEENYCPAWQQNKILAGELVLVLEDGSVEIGGKTLHYTTEGGLEEVRNGC